MRALSAGLVAVSLLVSSVAVAAEIKPTMPEIMKYTDAASALVIAKVCDQKSLFEYDFDEYREIVIDEIKGDLKERYSSEVMRVSYQKVFPKISEKVSNDAVFLIDSCYALNTALDAMVAEAEAEEMEF